MTPERLRQIRVVFEAASEQNADQRIAWLEQACGGDLELREEVQRLLTADVRESDLIDQPAFEQETSFPPLEGRRIGAYQVLREIGRGGMGAVYLARRVDDAFQKEVAVKVVHPDGGGPGAVDRFRQERQILAGLDHPNIARLLDGGTTDEGLPYFVMEYVEGEPIDRFCDQHKLTVTQRMTLFSAVCSAVQYAHQHLVIHRDLKPTNILVTADGTVKLLDFGIAKLLRTEAEGTTLYLTHTSIHLMTPEYASPEQARHETITTATDVYSLGVVLYELLTGHRPYHMKSRVLHEVIRIICEEEPTRPSMVISETDQLRQDHLSGHLRITPEMVSSVREGNPIRLRRRLVGDLDNILLLALRKQPTERYSSVEQFADDIRRHLEGLPVMAQQSTLWYRSLKFVHRHRGGVATAAAVFLLLVCGIGVTLWQAEVAQIQRQQAEMRARQLRSLAITMLTQIDDAVKRLPGNAPVRGLIIAESSKALKALAEKTDQPFGLAHYLTSRDIDERRGPQVPNGWFAAGFAPDLYEISVDRSVFHGGGASGYIAALHSEPGDWATLMQRIRADNYRGHRVRFSGFIKSEAASAAHLWMRVDAIGGIRAFDGMQYRPIIGTTEWQKYVVVLDVPMDSDVIFFGLLFVGPRGKAWMDDLELEIVSNDVPTTERVHIVPDETLKAPSHATNLGFEMGYRARARAAHSGGEGILWPKSIADQ